jgi:hypothetical protein
LVVDPTGRRLKIPCWMVLPASAEIQITERAHLSLEALRSLTSLLTSLLNMENQTYDNLLPTFVDGGEGGDRATTTLGSDPHGGATRARRRSDTKRTAGSHGPHAGGGISSGRRKSQ